MPGAAPRVRSGKERREGGTGRQPPPPPGHGGSAPSGPPRGLSRPRLPGAAWARDGEYGERGARRGARPAAAPAGEGAHAGSRGAGGEIRTGAGERPLPPPPPPPRSRLSRAPIFRPCKRLPATFSRSPTWIVSLLSPASFAPLANVSGTFHVRCPVGHGSALRIGPVFFSGRLVFWSVCNLKSSAEQTWLHSSRLDQPLAPRLPACCGWPLHKLFLLLSPLILSHFVSPFGRSTDLHGHPKEGESHTLQPETRI